MTRPLGYSRLAIAATLALAFAAEAPAGSESAKENVVEQRPTGFRADYLMELARLEQRMLALAREIPEAGYSARVSSEVHSIGDCFADLTSSCRSILDGMERSLPAVGETASTPRERAVADLVAVLDGIRLAVEDTPDQDLENPVDLLGRRWTVRATFLLLLSQIHEGLGHVSAHAEDNGIEPPWVKLNRISDQTDD